MIQTTKTTTIQRLIVLLPHYKSIRLSIIFFIDLLKYNYLSRSEGQAKMVHSLFRSNACYFSFYQQTYLLPTTAAQSLYSEKLLYTPSGPPPRSLAILHKLHNSPMVSYYYFLFIFYESETLRPHISLYCYYYCFQ